MLTRPSSRFRRTRRRPVSLEGLEPRQVPASGVSANLVMVGATSTDPSTVTITYDVDGADLGGPVALRVDRSTARDGLGASESLATGTLSGGDLTVGRHSRTVAIPGGLVIDPSHPYVRVMANGDGSVAESDRGDDTATFRIDTIAAVLGGVQADGGTDAWAGAVASALRSEGYDDVGAFQWRDRGLEARSGEAAGEAGTMVGNLRAVASRLTRSSPDDVVAVRIIGAGRGATAASLAMGTLSSASTPEALRAGWHSLTLVDPISATPGGSAAANVASPLGRLSGLASSWFAGQTNDPAPTIPANVQQADVYFERSGRSSALVDRLSGAPTAFAVVSAGAVSPTYHDASSVARGLSGLELEYLRKVAPSLGGPQAAELGRVVSAAVAGRAVRSAGASSAALDRRALVEAIPSRPLANLVFRQLQRDASLVARPRLKTAAVAAVQRTFQLIETQGSAVPNPISTALRGVLSRDLAALTGQPAPVVSGVQHLHPRGGINESAKAVTATTTTGGTVRAQVAAPDASTTSSGSSTLPSVVDLRPAFLDDPTFATPFDQQYEDCSVNSLAGAIDYLIATQPSLSTLDVESFEPSRLFLYYNTRFIEGDPFSDTGTYQSDAVAVATNQGFTSEGSVVSDSTGDVWTYPTSSTDQYQVNPGAANALTGALYTITSSTALDETASVDQLKQVLATKQVFTFWTNCEYFPDNNQDWPGFKPGVTPTLPAPPDKTPTPDDGHFMLCVGYDDSKQAFIVRNSWGSDWGINGFAYMPYSYFTTQIPNSNGAGTWSHPMYTINSIGVTAPPAPSIGDLSQLVPQPNIDTTVGQVHIDTSQAGAAGTATSFDYYDGSGGKNVTPLLFSYDTSTDIYTLTAVGASARINTKKTVGVPFFAQEGTTALGTNSVFGFYDGSVVSNGNGGFTFTPAAGSIPYATTSSVGPWLTTDVSGGLSSLSLGETFSLDAGAGTIALSSSASQRVYSAMLVTTPTAVES